MISLEATHFYGILDSHYVPPELWIEKYQALANGGAGLIQIRSQGASSDQLLALTKRVLAHRTSPSSQNPEQPHLILNDAIDLCLQFPALGLHLENSPLSPTEARKKLGPDRILGMSATSPEEVDQALSLPSDTLSYLSIGAVFPSDTKPEAPVSGLELVRYAAKQSASLPVFCIGGINRRNIDLLRQAGAKRIVSVSDVLCDADTSAAVKQSIALLRA